MKTGALLLFAVEAGARIGGADAAQRAALSALWRARSAPPSRSPTIFSTPRATTAALGKRAGKDAERNKATLVAALGHRRGAQACATRWSQEAIQALDDGGFGDRGRDPRGGRALHRRAKVLIMPQSGRWRRQSPCGSCAARPRLLLCALLGARGRVRSAGGMARRHARPGRLERRDLDLSGRGRRDDRSLRTSRHPSARRLAGRRPLRDSRSRRFGLDHFVRRDFRAALPRSRTRRTRSRTTTSPWRSRRSSGHGFSCT